MFKIGPPCPNLLHPGFNFRPQCSTLDHHTHTWTTLLNCRQSCSHLDNHAVYVFEGEFISHSITVYGFNTGYFASTSSCTTQARDIVPATDSCRYGSAMFNQFTKCPQIADSASDLLRCIEASYTTSTIHGYWLHSHRFLHRSTELDFWKIQAAIVALFMLSGL